MKKLRLREFKTAGMILTSALAISSLGKLDLIASCQAAVYGKQTAVTVKPDQKVTYKSYTNDLFWYSIEYPSTFKVKLIPTMYNDGRIFKSQDGKTQLTVYGSNNNSKDTVTTCYNNLLKEHKNAPYKKKGSNWFVVSWIEGNKIVYEKDVVGTGSINAFIIKYPVNQKNYYDPIVAHLDANFKTPGIEHSWYTTGMGD